MDQGENPYRAPRRRTRVKTPPTILKRRMWFVVLAAAIILVEGLWQLKRNVTLVSFLYRNWALEAQIRFWWSILETTALGGVSVTAGYGLLWGRRACWHLAVFRLVTELVADVVFFLLVVMVKNASVLGAGLGFGLTRFAISAVLLVVLMLPRVRLRFRLRKSQIRATLGLSLLIAVGLVAAAFTGPSAFLSR